MLSDDGAKIVRIILIDLEKGFRTLPTEVSLKDLEKKSQVRPQNIGMAFSPYIDQPLLEKGIKATKCGTPVRIQLRKVAQVVKH